MKTTILLTAMLAAGLFLTTGCCSTCGKKDAACCASTCPKPADCQKCCKDAAGCAKCCKTPEDCAKCCGKS